MVFFGWFGKKRQATKQEAAEPQAGMSDKVLKAHITRTQNQLARFSLERKYAQLQRLKLKREEQALDEDLADLQAELAEGQAAGDFGDFNPENLIMKLLTTKVMAAGPAASAPAAISQQAAAPAAPAAAMPQITDDILQAEIDKIPDDQLFKLMDYEDSKLKEEIKRKYPGLPDERAERAVQLIRASVEVATDGSD